MQKQVEWDAQQANVLVISLVESAKRKQNDIDDTDLDPELCQRTKAEMFGHFSAYLYRTSHTSHDSTSISCQNKMSRHKSC